MRTWWGKSWHSFCKGSSSLIVKLAEVFAGKLSLRRKARPIHAKPRLGRAPSAGPPKTAVVSTVVSTLQIGLLFLSLQK